jgi:hypothetical protein
MDVKAEKPAFMKKKFPVAVRMACFLTLLLSGSGCLKDKVTRTYSYYAPVYETLTQARSSIKTGEAIPVQAPGKISVYKNNLFIVEATKGIHVIDNSDPAHPKNISFIQVPGITNIAVANDILYADDVYGDLVSADIGDPAHAVIKKCLANIFPAYYGLVGAGTNPDSLRVITGLVLKDTTVSNEPPNTCINCQYMNSAVPGASNPTSAPVVGTNGSTAGFAILNDYLYAMAYTTTLNIVNISAAGSPSLSGQVNLGADYETIFPFEGKLFMGNFNGMYIYDLSNPAAPVKQGTFSHLRTCDPVIADGPHAFVTLHSGTTCSGYTNELDVLDITSLSNPSLLKIYALTNPRGLSKDGNLLFICDGQDGLKIFDATDVNNLNPVKNLGGFEANDVIAQHGNAIVIATDGIYQFDYSDIQHIQQLSKIAAHATTL